MAPIVVVILAALDVLFLFHAWPFLLKHQGEEHARVVVAINEAFIGMLLILIARLWREPTYARSVLVYWLTALWLVWYAFPWFGEIA